MNGADLTSSYETRFIPTISDAYHTEGVRTFWRGMHQSRPSYEC